LIAQPDDHAIQLQISQPLLPLDRKDEAAAARSGLHGADDPELLNMQLKEALNKSLF